MSILFLDNSGAAAERLPITIGLMFSDARDAVRAHCGIEALDSARDCEGREIVAAGSARNRWALATPATPPGLLYARRARLPAQHRRSSRRCRGPRSDQATPSACTR